MRKKSVSINPINCCYVLFLSDFFKQPSFEAQAFLEAVQFFRQEKGHYGSWEMITGNEVQILSNLVMEELLPSLQSMLLPKMKGKRNDRKRAWFGIIEETYYLVQDHVSEGLRALKEECKEVTKGLEGTVRSNMDQIITSKNFLAGKIKGSVSEPVQKCCSENIQPFLVSILEELMGPVSSGFGEVRLLFEKEVNSVSQGFQATNDITKLKESVKHMMNLPYHSVKMEPCYLKVNRLEEQLQDLKSRFKFYDIDLIIQRTQNLMQELLENAVYTFEQLLGLSHPKDLAKLVAAIEKVKLRVLKVLQEYEEYIFAEHTSVIQVENVYEEILLQALLDETLQVIKEAAHLKKHNLFEEMSQPFESVSSLSDLKTPSGSAQASPARKPASSETEVSETDTPSNEIFTPEKNTLEECHETMKPLNNKEASAKVSSIPSEAKEEIVISDLSGKEELRSVTQNAIREQRDPQLPNVVETTLSTSARAENMEPVQEKKPLNPDGVDEIRNLLTLTVELPVDTPSENTKQGLHEMCVLKPQESAEETGKEDRTNVEVCQTYETKETKVASPFTAEGNIANIASMFGEGSFITHTDPSNVSGELSVSHSRPELETIMWFTDVESSSTGNHFQPKPPAETGPSGQSQVGLSHFDCMDQALPVEQSAEKGIPNQKKEVFSSPHSVPMGDNRQTGQPPEGDFQEAELSSPLSVSREVDAPSFPGYSVETQESILNIAKLTIDPTDKPFSPELKESENSSLEALVKMDNKTLAFSQGDDSNQAGMPLPSTESMKTTEGERDRYENAEGNNLELQSEK
ncbi:hypothetical protein JD844_017367 [Phrynosoma platyrhinos]|uniref:Niban 1/2/3 domain-containing protein n=1 Tax=Phrynosoma platyrhinos TaxID=52577 RepID=A0ABQ7SLT0_PHRPL|nr:hypothetical protein JD844_017367 [Phrynosoma platyrhinos]